MFSFDNTGSMIFILDVCREYVVDLVGVPGNVQNPDSSINSSLLSSLPSPFQVSYVKGIQGDDVNDASWHHMLKTEQTCYVHAKPQKLGILNFTILNF